MMPKPADSMVLPTKPSAITQPVRRRLSESPRISRLLGVYRSLPSEVQRLADQAYERLKHDPRHLSLHFNKAGRFWSARIGTRYRALAVDAPDGLVWFWIGSHAGYDRLLA